MEQTFSYVMACFKWTKTVRGILVFCLSSVNFLTFISCFLFLLQISCIPFYGISSFLLVSVWAMLKTTVVSILHKEEAVLPSPLPRCCPLLCAALRTVSENSWIKSTLYHFCPVNTYLWSFSGVSVLLSVTGSAEKCSKWSLFPFVPYGCWTRHQTCV